MTRSGKGSLLRIGAFVLLALAAALPFGGRASASTLVVNCSIVSGVTELAAGIACGQFSIAGTLASISIAVSGGISGAIQLTNLSSTAQSGEGTTSTDFSFGALSGFTFVDPVFSASFSSGPRALLAGQTLTVAGLTASGTGSLGSNTTSFGDYSGAGFFVIPVSTSTFFSAAGTGGAFFASQIFGTSANATAAVTYTYDVPEPATVSLLGLALLGLGFAGDGKNKRAAFRP